ncbi:MULTISPECIES: copper resistance protein CopC [Mesobacillus]|uniref:copper resistance CopC family protein n=1 Tax=Mesobacillus TaxID=2675231 RepID=UPI00177FFEBA|nr:MULTISPECIES: copper resistance protein CopC [Mesobacillus]MCM3574081.1 copper resistance protein CopC [Mesobacillus subterraneus]UYZ21582.1 copper resistance protein CopC [Mesobacillus jeotgali]
MKKIWVIAILILISFNLKIEVFAHSYTKESNPAEGEIVKEPLDMIDITFETEIETIGELFLTHNNETYQVENITIEEDKLIGKLDKPLENGEYKATWKIVGEDGHPLEGTISFTVQVPDQTQTEASNREDETENQTEDSEQEGQEQNKEDDTLSQDEQNKQEGVGNSNFQKWFLPAAALTILIMALFIFRKGKK